MNSFNDGFLPCIGFLGFFILLFGFIAVMRFLSYRETLALAEKGLVRPDRARGNGRDTLRWGIAIASIGVALCVGLLPIGFLSNARFPFGPWMLGGLIPTFFGLGLVLIYVLTREEKRRDQGDKIEKSDEPPSA